MRSFLSKIYRHIHPHQQYRIIIGINVKITLAAAAFVHPTIIQDSNMVSRIAIDPQGIVGIRQIQQTFCGQSERIVASAK